MGDSVKNFTKVKIISIHRYLHIHQTSNLKAEGIRFVSSISLWKPIPTSPSHLLVLHMFENVFQLQLQDFWVTLRITYNQEFSASSPYYLCASVVFLTYSSLSCQYLTVANTLLIFFPVSCLVIQWTWNSILRTKNCSFLLLKDVNERITARRVWECFVGFVSLALLFLERKMRFAWSEQSSMYWSVLW